ncbi:probable cleavage and polyadenylation specificity factor subunit 2 [Hyalella azteca]|uniref:Cleavage and polyadenylation specificity factor subunit 2 n=2 Tax=Hyalella azteca TaxID=294128 RepID=A0A8B7NI27_HYAAZ|nr:probable cleavage and polyadenylation specificity factor subunit 2 [Hyalella azteca]
MSSIVKFEGIWGVGSETPHCYLLTVDDFTFLLDCGWDEKFDKDYIDRLSKAINHVDCVLLSFPDPLHLGAFPYLVGKCQLSCPVYATIPVYKNGQMFMYDWYQSHHSYDEFELFDLDDVDAAFERIIQVKYHQSINMRGKGLGMSISALPAGHMLGGCMWRITRDGEEDILYAVDYNHKKERHLSGCELDKIFRPSLLITDAFNATYRPERRRQRDLKFVDLPYIISMDAVSPMQTCNLCKKQMVSNTSYHVMHFARQMVSNTSYHVMHFARQMVSNTSYHVMHFARQMVSNTSYHVMHFARQMVSNTSYHVMHFARQMIEWMSEKLTKSFDSSRSNPFSLKHVKFCHTLADLAQLPSPKVVLASFPDLECGFSRELFMQWAASSKNAIILTSRTGEGTLARRLIDNPNLRVFKLMEKRRVILEGEELEEHLAMLRQHRVMERMKDPVVDSSDEEEDPELQLLESGKHDIICLESKTVAGGQGPMRSRKHHHMFPYHEEKTRSDEYGEFINHADFEHLVPTLTEGDDDAAREPLQQLNRDIIGWSLERIIPSIIPPAQAVSPGRIILVRGSQATLNGHAGALRSVCPHTPIHTPVLGQVVLASTHTLMQQIQLSDPLLRSLKFFRTSGIRGAEVAWLDGITKKRKRTQQLEQVISSAESVDDELLVVEEAPPEKICAHDTVLINELRLSDFKQVLAKAGVMAEFNAGILWCANGTVALRKQEAGNIAVEGALTEDYFTVRELLYAQYALL